MFHSTPSYSDMTSVATANAATYQTTTNPANTPVYVPSNRAITHAQYGHANFAGAQNGWPSEHGFGKKVNFKS